MIAGAAAAVYVASGWNGLAAADGGRPDGSHHGPFASGVLRVAADHGAILGGWHLSNQMTLLRMMLVALHCPWRRTGGAQGRDAAPVKAGWGGLPGRSTMRAAGQVPPASGFVPAAESAARAGRYVVAWAREMWSRWRFRAAALV